MLTVSVCRYWFFSRILSRLFYRALPIWSIWMNQKYISEFPSEMPCMASPFL